MKQSYREQGNQRQHVYTARRKVSGWYGRRFGKNPRYKRLGALRCPQHK